MSYEDALKKSGLINLCQRREDACVTFLKRSYYSSDLLRNLVTRCQFQDHMPSGQEELCLYLPPQDLLDLEIFVLLNIRIMCNILNCNLSYYL